MKKEELAKKMNMELGDLFKTDEERDKSLIEEIQYIDLELIDDFPNHPFKIREDEQEMQKLIASVEEYGVLMPVILRPKNDGRYEIISGHRRKYACLKSSKKKISAIVRNYTGDEAIILMVDSNIQRENILPSEKAFAYKMKLEAMKRQGFRSDLTSSPKEKKLVAEEIGKDFGDGKDTVYRYIRLTNLLPEILKMVDDNQIALKPAVEISYLSQREQMELLKTMQIDEVSPSLNQAHRIKEFSKLGKLDADTLLSVMSERKPNQAEKIVLKRDALSKYLPRDLTPKQVEDLIIKLIEKWYKSKQKVKNEER